MSTSTTKPQKTYSLEDFVNSGDSTTITYDSLSMTEKVDNIAFPIFNVIDDYIDELISVSELVDLNEDAKFKYKYRPRLLCEHLYGNGELYFIILLINGICNIKEFTLTNNNIRLIKKDVLIDMLKQIYKAEKSQIDNYNENEDSD